MQARPYLELALQEKITRKDSSASTLIDLIQYDAEAKLDSVDADDKSFLHHALSVGFKEAADKLLLLQIDNDIIFKADKSGHNCLSLAIEQDYTDIFKILFDKAIQAQSGSSGYKIWLKPDANGNTLLHVAAMHRNIEAAELLLEQISQENKEKREDIIDAKTTLERNTPLHLACLDLPTPRDEKLISLLIKHGAGLERINLSHQTPFNLICTFDIEIQKNILALLLKDDAQEEFLKYYGAYLKSNSKNPDAFYNKMLKNYNELCRERDAIIYMSEAKEVEDILVEEKVSPPPFQFIPKELLDFANLAEENQISLINNQQLLEWNEEKIQEDIMRFNEYIDDLNARSTVYLSGTTLFRLTAVTMIASYIAIEVWLALTKNEYYKMWNNYTDHNHRQYYSSWSSYFFGTMFFGLLGGMAVIFTLVGLAASLENTFSRGLNSYLDIPIKISSDEWNQLITNLQNTWLEGMQELERKQEKDKLNENHRLPQQLIRDFEDNIAAFGDEKKTVTNTIADMTHISENLTSVKNYITSRNTSILPLSMFKRDTRIDISKARVGEVNEKAALLNHRATG